MSHHLLLAGSYGSPYSLKMRAVLRYRHIPFKWVLRNSKWDDIGAAPVPLIPVIVFPNPDGTHGEKMVDSSPQITRLEAEFTGRSVVPNDPALAFGDALIEDFADEWLTKAMYHYRWTYEADIGKAGKLLPLSQNLQLDTDGAQQMYEFITSRQIGRRELVGSTEWNAPVIEDSYKRVLRCMQHQMASHDFLLGDRPGRADFGIYGQFTQLVRWDPTPIGVAIREAPKTITWTDRVDDLSWLDVIDDEGWLAREDMTSATRSLLEEIGRTYAPFMLTNASAIVEGADEVVCEIDGREYRQGPFKYQAKCLRWLRADYAALSESDRNRVDVALDGTGCEQLFVD